MISSQGFAFGFASGFCGSSRFFYFLKPRPPPDINPSASDVSTDLFLSVPRAAPRPWLRSPASAIRSTRDPSRLPAARGLRRSRRPRLSGLRGSSRGAGVPRCAPGAVSRVASAGGARGMKARGTAPSPAPLPSAPPGRGTAPRARCAGPRVPGQAPSGDGGAGSGRPPPSLAFNATLARTDVPGRADCPDPAQLCPW